MWVPNRFILLACLPQIINEGVGGARWERPTEDIPNRQELRIGLVSLAAIGIASSGALTIKEYFVNGLKLMKSTLRKP